MPRSKRLAEAAGIEVNEAKELLKEFKEVQPKKKAKCKPAPKDKPSASEPEAPADEPGPSVKGDEPGPSDGGEALLVAESQESPDNQLGVFQEPTQEIDETLAQASPGTPATQRYDAQPGSSAAKSPSLLARAASHRRLLC